MEVEGLTFPVMIKEEWTGGGKGVKQINHLGELINYIDRLREEKKDEQPLLIQQFIPNARQVEIQMWGGNNLGYRETSGQLNNTKQFEWGSKKPRIPGTIKAGKDSVNMANMASRRYGENNTFYTDEFLVDESNIFYWLEKNMRLQLEYLFTLLTSGIDFMEALIVCSQDPNIKTILKYLNYFCDKLEIEIPKSANAEDILKVIKAKQPDGVWLGARINAQEPIIFHGKLVMRGVKGKAYLSEGADNIGVWGIRSGDEIDTAVVNGFIGHVIVHDKNISEAQKKLITALETPWVTRISTNQEMQLLTLQNIDLETCHTKTIDQLYDKFLDIFFNLENLTEKDRVRAETGTITLKEVLTKYPEILDKLAEENEENTTSFRLG